MTQNSSNGIVRIFSARACAAPLEKAAKLFEEQSGIHVEIDVCSRHCASPVAEEALLGNADLLDAAICVLAGRDFLDWKVLPPENPDLARKEGWIWIRPPARSS